jgi:hypothetical protein
MLAEVCAVTANVATEQVADEDCPNTTDAGTVADFELDATFTETAVPFAGVALRVTVPVDLAPPPTVLGFKVSPVTWNGITERLAVTVTVP